MSHFEHYAQYPSTYVSGLPPQRALSPPNVLPLNSYIIQQKYVTPPMLGESLIHPTGPPMLINGWVPPYAGTMLFVPPPILSPETDIGCVVHPNYHPLTSNCHLPPPPAKVPKGPHMIDPIISNYPVSADQYGLPLRPRTPNFYIGIPHRNSPPKIMIPPCVVPTTPTIPLHYTYHTEETPGRFASGAQQPPAPLPSRDSSSGKVVSLSQRATSSTRDETSEEKSLTDGLPLEFCPEKKCRVLQMGGPFSITDDLGVVVYWMRRDLRVEANHAFSRAQEIAHKYKIPLIVYFSPFESKTISHRLATWKTRGLQTLQRTLATLNIPLVVETSPHFPVLDGLLNILRARNFITDFSPLRESNEQLLLFRTKLPSHVHLEEVDAHNILPCWAVDEIDRAFVFKRELAKLKGKDGLYYVHIPAKIRPQVPLNTRGTNFSLQFDPDWAQVISHLAGPLSDSSTAASSPPVEWGEPGEFGAKKQFFHFLEHIKGYFDHKNDPVIGRTSKISPFINSGFISSAYIVHQLTECRTRRPDLITDLDYHSYVNEVFLWREMADNFIYYNKNYDSVSGFRIWARKSIMDHAGDFREETYTKAQLEKAQTKDGLWNVAQKELLMFGLIAPYLRIYWAKRLVEWCSYEDALSIAIEFNNKWAIDGESPQCYSGIAWAIGGTMDRAFPDRLVTGRIRQQKATNLSKKFDTTRWIHLVEEAYKLFIANNPSYLDLYKKVLAPVAKRSPPSDF